MLMESKESLLRMAESHAKECDRQKRLGTPNRAAQCKKSRVHHLRRSEECTISKPDYPKESMSAPIGDSQANIRNDSLNASTT
jgi:hypothetical protein